MKLAFCIFKYFPFGGLQRDFLRLARLCYSVGHEVHVYTMQWEGEPEAGLHLHLISAKGWQNHTRIRRFLAKCAPELTDGRYDVVIGFNKMPYLHLYYAGDVCYEARIRDSKPFWYRMLPRSRYYRFLEKEVFAAGKSTKILLLSAVEQAKYEKYYHTEATRFKILSPSINAFAVNEAHIIRANLRAHYHIPPEDFLILMVGSGFKTKGVDRTLHALSSLPLKLQSHCHLFIIGRDNAEPFQRLAKKLKLNQINFIGPRSDVPHFLQAADCLLHPSYHENTGTVILEALVAGLPVLTLSVCGYASYVNQANAGYVLPSPYSQPILNQALIGILDKSRLATFKKNALAFASKAPIYDNSEEFLQSVKEIGERSEPTDLNIPYFLQPTLRQTLSAKEQHFTQMMALKGEEYRQQKNRLTQRIEIANQSYFIKQHYGVGLREIFKNLLQGKWPVLGAKNEWLALNMLRRIGLAAPLAWGYGVRGKNPAQQQSFILLEALTNKISLEDLCASWRENPPDWRFKRALIKAVAQIAKKMHDHGINHRDFYLCHFLMDKTTSLPTELYLFDLHRAQIRSHVPLRWQIKDLAGLYFSSRGIGLTQRDLYYFMKQYSQMSLRDTIINQGSFWKKVEARGNELYKKHHG